MWGFPSSKWIACLPTVIGFGQATNPDLFRPRTFLEPFPDPNGPILRFASFRVAMQTLNNATTWVQPSMGRISLSVPSHIAKNLWPYLDFYIFKLVGKSLIRRHLSRHLSLSQIGGLKNHGWFLSYPSLQKLFVFSSFHLQKIQTSISAPFSPKHSCDPKYFVKIALNAGLAQCTHRRGVTPLVMFTILSLITWIFWGFEVFSSAFFSIFWGVKDRGHQVIILPTQTSYNFREIPLEIPQNDPFVLCIKLASTKMGTVI